MHGEPSVRDGGFDRRAKFLIAATRLSKLPVDHLYRQSLGMIELDSVRQLKQFSLGGLGRRERTGLFEFHDRCFRRVDAEQLGELGFA
jgi:hypothetical protein